MKLAVVIRCCWSVLIASAIHAAEAPPLSGADPLRLGRELPDELTLNVGTVMRQDNVGGAGAASLLASNVTVVLTKRSMRADNCRSVLWNDAGFKDIDIPVTTYRGYVKNDPLMQVNGNIEPGGVLNLNFSDNRGIVGRIRGMKIAIPEGRCTSGTTTGIKVVPLSSLRRRAVPSPGGYLIPEVPMRRTRWIVQVYSTYTAHAGIEKAVSEVEQRMNDADFIYARDVGTAWEIDTLLVIDAKATKPADLNALYAGEPGRIENCKRAGFTGVEGRNQGKRALNVTGVHHEARILLHESAHVYGNPWHQLGAGDGLCGGGAFWDVNNVAILLEAQKGAHAALNETNFPAVIYSGPLPPRATYDFAATRRGAPVTIDVLENDYDGNGDTLSLQAVQEKSDRGGTVAVSKDGKAVYTPAPGFVGLDKFTYTVVDSTGVGNRSGQVKVDVREEGLAVHFDFEDPQEELAVDTPWDPRPEAERLVYHFRNKGPYESGSRGTAVYMDYLPVDGIRGKGIWNPGVLRQGRVQLGDLGDPGRGSLSASVWVLYPPSAADGGRVLLCKGGTPFAFVNGWAIAGNPAGGKFEFSGNVSRVLPSEAFSLASEETIEPNRWYHLVMVIDREKKRLRAWVNNKEVAPDANVRIPDGVIEYYGELYLFNTYGGKWWNGSKVLIDEVKVFTSALTPKQVAELYAAGQDAKVPDLKGAKPKPASSADRAGNDE